jgi:hypothetical protein
MAEMTGMLDGVEQRKFEPGRPRQPYVNDPGLDNLILASVEETARCRSLEQQRAKLARHLSGIFDDELKEATDRALGKGYPPNTIRAYKTEIKKFRAWCADEGFSSLPSFPECVAYYLLTLAGNGAKPNALERAIAAIRYAHILFDSGHRLVTSHCDLAAPVIVAVLSWCRKRWAEDKQKDTADGDQQK